MRAITTGVDLTKNVFSVCWSMPIAALRFFGVAHTDPTIPTADTRPASTTITPPEALLSDCPLDE